MESSKNYINLRNEISHLLSLVTIHHTWLSSRPFWKLCDLLEGQHHHHHHHQVHYNNEIQNQVALAE